MSENVLGVIPARGGSKGIPRKNLIHLNGKPLISHIIKSALNTKSLDRVIVSTDDEEIARVAKKYGAEVPFLRPKELANDTTSLIPVIKHATDYLKDAEGWTADIVVSLQPTSPLTTPLEIDSAVCKLMETGCDSVVGVCQATDHPFWTYKLKGDRVFSFQTTNQRYLQRQDLPEAYVFSGALYVRKRELIDNWTGSDFALGEDIRSIKMSKHSRDIHDLEDLWIIEKIIKDRQP